jgi:hypothetical protein
MAHWALLSFPPLMNSKMFIEISFLGKGLITIRFLTFERTFTSVDTKMIKKIMPLSEKHFASIVITF